MLGQDKKAEEFAKVYDDFVEAVDKVLWNTTEKVWLDLNTKTKMQKLNFTLAILHHCGLIATGKYR